MKKVAVSTSSSSSSVFEDPLFNPGDSFKPRDSDDYIAPSSKQHSSDLVNTLTGPDDDSALSTPKPMQTIRTAKPSQKQRTETEKEQQEQQKEQKDQQPAVTAKSSKEKKKVDPLAPTSVFDNDGEDLFLPSSNQKKETTSTTFEDELFGKSTTSQSGTIKSGGSKNLRLGAHDSDSDNEINDLGVGAIMEREDLDFDMFGKSSVRQFEPMETDDSNSRKENATKVGKDDLVLESNDILSDFESMLSDNGTKKKSTISSPVTLTTTTNENATKSVVVDNSYDIDAYISQQEDGGGGLFD